MGTHGTPHNEKADAKKGLQKDIQIQKHTRTGAEKTKMQGTPDETQEQSLEFGTEQHGEELDMGAPDKEANGMSEDMEGRT